MNNIQGTEDSLLGDTAAYIIHFYSLFFQYGRQGIPLGFAMRPREPCYLDVIGTARVIGFYDAKYLFTNL